MATHSAIFVQPRPRIPQIEFLQVIGIVVAQTTITTSLHCAST